MSDKQFQKAWAKFVKAVRKGKTQGRIPKALRKVLGR